MLGNVALDVVIGIVFVYLLYSLYATVIMEIIASFFGLRARNLMYALRRMLMDEKKYEDKPTRQRLSRMMTSFIQMSGYATNLENDVMLKKFFEQRSIKSLSSGGVNNLPSYMNPESFTKAIIDAIKTDTPDLNEVFRIREGLSQAPHTALKAHLTSLMDDANNDLVKFRALVDEWFNTTMDRAGGWYKRSVQMILLVTGLFIAVIFNVDTLAIIKKLSTDKDARAQMVTLATKYADAHINDNKTVSVTDKDSVTYKRPDNATLDSLMNVKTLLKEDIESSQNILSSAWNLSSPLRFHIIINDNIPLEPKDSVFIKHRIGKDTLIVAVVHKSVDPEILKARLPACLTGKNELEISVFAYKWVYFWRHLAGYLLTVLAISLGSPFWFDLLNKLVKLKTSKRRCHTRYNGYWQRAFIQSFHHKHNRMRGLILNRINERIRPHVNATVTRVYEKDSVVEVIGSETGQDLDQNDQWYKLRNGNYLWSGGVKVHLTDSDLPPGDRLQFMINYRQVKNGQPRQDTKSAPDKLYFTPINLPPDDDSVRVEHWDEETFSAKILDSVKDMPPHRKHVMIYIHGYQLQLFSTLKLDLLSGFVLSYMMKKENSIAKVIYFSWPSQSGPSRETVDDRAVLMGEKFTDAGFFNYFTKLSEDLRLQGRTLNLVAHSFGHQLLNGMINPNLPDNLPPLPDKVFEHVFLMAPDISQLSCRTDGSPVDNVYTDRNSKIQRTQIFYNLSPLTKLANHVHVFYDKYDFLLYSSSIRFAGDDRVGDDLEMVNFYSLGNYGAKNLANSNMTFKWYDVEMLTKGSAFDNLWDYPFRPLKQRFNSDIEMIWKRPSNYSDIKPLKIATHRGLFEDHHRYLFTCEPVVNKVLEILNDKTTQPIPGQPLNA